MLILPWNIQFLLTIHIITNRIGRIGAKNTVMGWRFRLISWRTFPKDNPTMRRKNSPKSVEEYSALYSEIWIIIPTLIL
jgi:hypothetical protein